MKTEKTMKAKKITLLSAVVAIAAVAITLTAVLLPKYKVTKASTGNEKNTAEIERTISQIESLEAEYQKSFDENAALWEKYFAEFQKLDEIPEIFDERAFIKELKTLTDDEKTALLKNVDALDALDAKLDKLYDELYDKDEDVLYNDCKDGSCGFSGNGCGEYDVLFIECDENCFAENCGKEKIKPTKTHLAKGAAHSDADCAREGIWRTEFTLPTTKKT